MMTTYMITGVFVLLICSERKTYPASPDVLLTARRDQVSNA